MLSFVICCRFSACHKIRHVTRFLLTYLLSQIAQLDREKHEALRQLNEVGCYGHGVSEKNATYFLLHTCQMVR